MDAERPPAPRVAAAGTLEATLGPLLVARLYGLLRALRLYDTSNQAIRDAAGELTALIGRLLDGELVFVAMGQCFYVNGVRVRAEPSQVGLFDALTEEFTRRRLGGLRFVEGMRPDELTVFLGLFVRIADAGAAERLAEASAGAGVAHVVPVTLDELESVASGEATDQEPATDARARARETHARAVHGARGAIVRTVRTGKPAIRRVKRVVQPIVDTIMRNECSIVGLTAIKNHDEYTYVHCVNVSILSVAMGQALGLSRAALANLGVAALLHDVGKVAVPAEVLAKPGRLDPDEWRLMWRHPIEGARIVSRVPGLSDLTLDLLRVCLQHHRTMDGAGYPHSERPMPLATPSRIVAVADVYDAMTAHREYRRRPFSGYEVLQILLGGDHGRYDPAALWALVRTVGLYPAGTLLRASTGHLVLSLGVSPADPRRPDVRVMARPDGTSPPDAEPEIWSPLPEGVTIASVVRADEFEGEVHRLLAA